MDKIVLYTKTFSRDLDRIKHLIQSVKKYNRNNIPFYISIPKTEEALFKTNIDTDYVKIIFDQDIVDIKSENWNTQQIIKSSFWKLNLCENYVMIDSDSYFIKDFYISDFMYDENTPYTVMHEQKDLFEWSSKYQNLIGIDPKIGFEADRKKIMQTFNREGRYYDFGPSPTIWSSKVWESLEANLIKNNRTFIDLIKYIPSEFSWYGEFLLTTKIIDILPVGPLFKVFHYKPQYEHYKQLGYTEDNFSKNYLGIVLQSNFSTKVIY